MSIDVPCDDDFCAVEAPVRSKYDPVAVGVTLYQLQDYDWSGQTQIDDVFYPIRFERKSACRGAEVGSVIHSSIYEHSVSNLDPEVELTVSPEQQRLVNDIREYFLNKSTMMKLLDQIPSNYLTDMVEYLRQSDRRTFQYNQIGMLASLPKAYIIDRELDFCLDQCVTDNLPDYYLENEPLELIRVTPAMGKELHTSLYFRGTNTGLLIVNHIKYGPGYEHLMQALKSNPIVENMVIHNVKARQGLQQSYFSGYNYSIIPEGYTGY